MQTLFKHQEEGIKFLIAKKKAILADQQGLGKSKQAIMAAIQSGTESVLILCPASLKTNWAREIRLVDPEATITILNGKNIEPYGQGGNGDWLIVNYDITHRPENEKIISTYMKGTIILDEAHYIKNSKSKRTKAVLAIVKNAENVYLLTGTPIQNRPEEVFTLLQAVGHPLGNNWFSFVHRYCGAFKQQLRNGRSFLNTGGATNLIELKTRIATSYIRREKDQLPDLPEKIITNVEVEIDDDSRAKYARAWDDYLNYLQNNPVIFEDMDEEERAEKMQNILQAKHLVELQKLKQISSLAKIPRIIEDVLNTIEQGEKIIIFTQYTETLRQLRTGLAAEKILAVTLSGEDDATARQISIDAFQNNPNVKVFIGNMQAAGVGITLTAASTVMFGDLGWTPALHEQCEDRAHRIGARKMVNVYYYIAKDTIEEDIIELLGKKNQIIQTILAGTQKRVGQFNVANELLKKINNNFL